MSWFAFKGSGSIYNLTGVPEAEMAITGAHGYATKAEAEAHPNAQESGLQSAILAGTQITASSPVGGGTVGVQSGTTPALSTTSLADFLKQGGSLMRIVEIAVGGILLIVAVKGMLPANVQRVPGKVGKAVMFK